MDTQMAVGDRTDASTLDERWAAWVAKSAEHDKKIKKRAVAAAAVMVSGFGLWAAMVLLS